MSGQICKANLQADKKRQIRELSVRVARGGVSYPHHSLRFTNRILLSTIRLGGWSPFLSRTGKYRFFAFVGPLAFWRAESDKTIEQNVYIFINIRIKSTFADGVNPEEVHRFAKPYRLRVGKPAARGCAKPPVLQEDGMFSYKKGMHPKAHKRKELHTLLLS